MVKSKVQTNQEAESGSGGIRVIARAMDVLRALSKHPEGLTLGEIAQLIGLPRSTVQRIVKALDDENMVIAASLTSGVRLGPALLTLAAKAKKFDIADLARPMMVQLARETGETVDLAILGADKAVVVDQVAGTHPLMAVSAAGESLPLHGSASGKVLLASLAPERLAHIRQRLVLTPLTPHTITHWERLESELDEIRRNGYASDVEEYRLGICAMGMSLRMPGDEVAVISMPVPSDRFKATRDQLFKALTERCATLQRRL